MAVLAVLLVGCGASTGSAVGPDVGCSADGTLDYRTFGAPFMRDWCTGCHSADLMGDDRAGAPVGVDFDSVAGVRSHLMLIQQRATGDAPTMPPKGPPGPAERGLLEEWIACGAP
jgi:hypothetical protein